MAGKIKRGTIVILLWSVCLSCASGSVQNNTNQEANQADNSVDAVLSRLTEFTRNLESLQCKVDYKHVQPSIFNTQVLRKGMLYYSRGDDKTVLRVNFETLQQDDAEPQKYIEQYIVVDGASIPGKDVKYKGYWLVHMDYDFKTAKYIQIAPAGEPNKPVDVFDLISKNLPMIGFTKIDKLKSEFEITLPEVKKDESEDIIQVNLKVKPNSVYKNDYVLIECYIDKKLNLPLRIKAFSTDPGGEPLGKKDYHELKFIDLKTNVKISKDVFDFNIPDGFDEPEIFPLNEGT